MKMGKELGQIFKYFAQYDYAPSLSQIHTFYPTKTSKHSLITFLEELVSKNILIKASVAGEIVYAPKIKAKTIQIRQKRTVLSIEKYSRAQKVAQILGKIPQVQLVGLSGSVAVANAKKSDDIDFFIITKAGNLWSGRILILIFLQILGVRRRFGEKNVANKICCNLLFDGRD